MSTSPATASAPIPSASVRARRALVERIGLEWKVGDRLPPISDLARELRVSPNAVQLAVHELVHDGVLFSRKRLGLFVLALPTSPDDAGQRSDRPLSGKSIALVAGCDPVPPFIQRMMAGFRSAAIAAGGVPSTIIAIGDLSDLPSTPTTWALALFNPGGDARLPDGYTNAVVVSTADHLHRDLLTRFGLIGVDQYQGGMLAGSVMRAAGCQRACFLGHRIDVGAHRYDLTSGLRLSGFEHAWGCHLDPANLLYAPGYSVQAGALRFCDYMAMDPRPDAVFAASDELAMGFRAAATAIGLAAGRDFQLVGFDRQDVDASTGDDSLTTIRAPIDQMGRVAVQVLSQRADGQAGPPQRIALPCSISPGTTTRSSIHVSYGEPP